MAQRIVIFLLLFLAVPAIGQSIKEIELHPEIYIFGYGRGATEQGALNNAKLRISEQISTTVQSQFIEQTHSETLNAGQEESTTIQSVINTYSNNTLVNCRTIYISRGPDMYEVMTYMPRKELKNIFDERKQKIKDMLDVAVRAEQELKIDDALRYYYWSLLLCNTLPLPARFMYYVEEEDRQYSAPVWIQQKISDVFNSLEVRYLGTAKDDDCIALLGFAYKGQPVASISYSCNKGGFWTGIIAARNGIGTVDLSDSKGLPSLEVMVEYRFENIAGNDPQVRNLLKDIPPVSFSQAIMPKITLKLASRDKHTPVVNETPLLKGTGADALGNSDKHALQKIVYSVADALKTGRHDAVKDYFTAEGLAEYDKLLRYGAAKVISRPDLSFVHFCDETYCRSVPMQFSFNRANFVENVVFVFNKDQKISGVQFAIENRTISEIMAFGWPEDSKTTLINFLETYRTAFALKNLGYMENIFSDTAIIITGRVVKKINTDNAMRGMKNEYVEYNRYTKSEYIGQLRSSFSSKEYINIKFSNANIGNYKKGTNENLYGIQLKQDYYSSNYADSGYLYLLVDLGDPERPTIHIRTWQPERDSEFGLFGPDNM